MIQTDLISRSAVIDRIAEFLGPKGLDEWEVMMAIREIVENAPTIDAVPVVHARWDRLMGDYYCTNCDKRLRRSSRTKRPKYCERCGARMDEKEND